MIYDAFLDNTLQPQQQYYADVLKHSETWCERFPEPQINDLLEEFRNRPCINDPTEGRLEQIERDQDGYPILLAVLLNADLCGVATVTQNLNEIVSQYGFFADGKTRMLAYEFLPWEDEFSAYRVGSKYRNLGRHEVNNHHIRKCLIIPKTDRFRDEGDHFYSRPYFGTFDVLAICETYLH
ncbi:hypothetical protein [Bradyrhizobium algeriense]|uniref:hypothetical protein n=1 Tax=Bradyrhizobium algeriense TaxID=634784 RepID=UPI000D38003F|nr:hypothetical protein [Bradyrhizobium algeriense]